MAKLTYKQREKLPSYKFALPEKRKYPVTDKAHARNALARVQQHGTPKEKGQVRRYVFRRFPELSNKPPRISK